MHTLPLPEVPDDRPNTKIENGGSKLASAQMEPRASNSEVGVSAQSPHLTPQQFQFLLRVTPAALESQRAYEIPACVTIAQAILESATPQFGWGSSTLFRLANNPFGIKYCHFPSGDRVIGRSGDRASNGGSKSSDHPNSSTEQQKTDRRNNGSDDQPILKDQVKVSNPIAGSPDLQITAASAHPITGSPDLPIEDYGHFDAQTWEIENGQKKVMIAQFQRFPNLGEAFRCHALLLATSPRYAPAMRAVRDQGSGIRDQERAIRESLSPTPNAQPLIPAWQQFAERLGPKTSQQDTEHCGYSTNPSYSAELIKLVNLYRLNDPRALEWYATGQDPALQKPIADGRLPIAPSPADRQSAIGNPQSSIVCDPEIGQ